MNPVLIRLLLQLEALGLSFQESRDNLRSDQATINGQNNTELDKVLAGFDAAWNLGDAAAALTGFTGDLGAALSAFVSAGGTPAAFSEALGGS
jgi:hypothetical protein